MKLNAMNGRINLLSAQRNATAASPLIGYEAVKQAKEFGCEGRCLLKDHRYS
jgi:hypothetical protein